MKQQPLLAHAWGCSWTSLTQEWVCGQRGGCEGLGEIVEGSLAESNPPAARQASLSVVRGFRQPAH